MAEIIDIVKFKITVFMAIIAASGFLAINFAKLEKVIGEYKIILIIIILFLTIYGIIGFIINMLKLSKIEKGIKWD